MAAASFFLLSLPIFSVAFFAGQRFPRVLPSVDSLRMIAKEAKEANCLLPGEPNIGQLEWVLLCRLVRAHADWRAAKKAPILLTLGINQCSVVVIIVIVDALVTSCNE